jgi:ectoine hydroxylase-related dioxygenase (phytanoyl-CoA dioxygenase family)
MLRQLDEQGFCVVPDVLSGEALTQARAALDRAIEQTRARGISTFTDIMDPNDANVRVYNLPAHDELFREMLRHPAALPFVEAVIGPNFLVSNFTANIALPGSNSMKLHSDQALVIPQPWLAPWAINIIWCLDDVHERNGATRYLPGSHRYPTFDDLPPDAASRTLPFEASAGSLIAMEGRLWHTSGANITTDEKRALMFAYYTCDFIRPSVNWEATLPPEVKDGLDRELRTLLGIGSGNTRLGGDLVRLPEAERNQA